MNSRRPAGLEAAIAGAAVIAIGSNLPGRFGPPRQMVERAMAALRRLSESPPRFSPLYSSKPRSCPPGAPDFVNAVAALWPPADLPPEALLAQLLRIEAEFGRVRNTVANAPRTLDLDLICWGGRTADTATLRLPHPRFASREFVLAPLAQLVPRWIPPGQSRSVSTLLEALPGKDDVQMIPLGACAAGIRESENSISRGRG